MILTTKGRYAVMAIIEIADNIEGKPVSLLTISENQKISLSYLEQIFSCLRKSGIVASVKGPGGGYILGKNRAEITVAEIIKAIGEQIKMTRCDSVKKNCLGKSGKAKCKTHQLWKGLENSIYQYLASISLQDICN
jgi:Rrf2 family iron-sulfur cluster assembly transcriptional regulator